MVTEVRQSKCTIYGSNGLPNPQYAPWQTNGRKDKDELVHSSKGEFIYNNNWGTSGAREGRVIRLSNANNVQQKHLTILLIDGAHGHTHAHTNTQKEMDFIAPSARREDELRGENVLATWPRSRGWTTAPSWSTSRQRTDQGSRTQRMRDEVISHDEMVNRLL